MTRYVAGFLFDPDYTQVVLIKKNKPDWQKGKWNAVGGKVEDGELMWAAMRREFQEETGLEVFQWFHFCTLNVPSHDAEVNFFFTTSAGMYRVKMITDEEVAIHPVGKLPMNSIANLHWLCHMAMSMPHDLTAFRFEITEVTK